MMDSCPQTFYIPESEHLFEALTDLQFKGVIQGNVLVDP